MSNIKENSSKITGFQRKKNILGTALEKKKARDLEVKLGHCQAFWQSSLMPGEKWSDKCKTFKSMLSILYTVKRALKGKAHRPTVNDVQKLCSDSFLRNLLEDELQTPKMSRETLN